MAKKPARITLEALGFSEKEMAGLQAELDSGRMTAAEALNEAAPEPSPATSVASEVHKALMEDGTPEQLDNYSFETQQVIDLAKTSPDFLAGLAMPEVFKYMLPPMYVAIWDWMVENIQKGRSFPQLAIGLPRGFAKTTLLKLFILYCILFTDRRFILVINAAEKLAVNTISDIVDMLNEPNIQAVFGNWKLGLETDRQDFKKFSFRGRDVILAAMGAEGSLRGIVVKNRRPDVMLFDDIQSRECADSQIQSDTLERWMYGTAMKAKSPEGCLFVFLANMYPTKWSILRKLKSNSSWVKFIVGGILSDGTSLWEELQPIQQLLQEFQNDLNSGHPEIFYSEVLNDENATVNKMIDLTKIPAWPWEVGEIAVGGAVIIDPSNDKANSDAVAIGAMKVYDAVPALIDVKEEKLSPGDTIREALKMCFKHNIKLVVIESNAYQFSLLYWFNHICQQLGVEGIIVRDIYSGGRSKNSRILDMFKAYLAGEVQVHPDARSHVHFQISQWNALRRDNVDNTLDLVSYMPKIVAEFAQELQFSADIVLDSGDYEEVLDTDVVTF